jgi:hypothetical protein
MTTPSTCPEIIKTRSQFIACVPPGIVGTFWARAKAAKGVQWVIQQQAGLLGGYASIPSAYIFQLVPIVAVVQGTTQLIGGQLVQVGGVYEEARPRSLAEANMFYANELLSEAPTQFVRDLAVQTGVRVDQSELDMRAGVAIITAGAATRANELIPNAIERARAAAGATGSSFWDKFTSGLKKLVTHPGDWLQRVFVTEPGKALQWAGRQLLSLQKNAWTKWLIDPLGVFRQLGAFLRELGHAMVEGSITAFEEQAFAKENARHWREVGAALAVAAPFLPPPFNIIALGLSAVFIAAGTYILASYAAADAERAAEKQAAQYASKASAARTAAKQAQAQALFVADLESAPPATHQEVLGPTQPDPDDLGEAAPRKIFGLDARAVAVVVSGALIWGLYGKA